MQAEREFGAESVWPYYYAGTMGLVMRDGINRLAHVKKYSRFYSHDLRQHRARRLCHRHRQDRRRRSARDGRLRSGRDLGHQPREHPGQRDDACDARPQRTRRQDRGGRRLQQRHHEAGRHQDPAAARHRRRLRLRRHACAVPRRSMPTAPIWSATPIVPPNSRRIWRPARRNGRRRSRACRSRRSRRSRAWSARPNARSSGSAMALPAAATARRRCMRRCAFRP